jgi:hypothetical protein
MRRMHILPYKVAQPKGDIQSSNIIFGYCFMVG